MRLPGFAPTIFSWNTIESPNAPELSAANDFDVEIVGSDGADDPRKES